MSIPTHSAISLAIAIGIGLLIGAEHSAAISKARPCSWPWRRGPCSSRRVDDAEPASRGRPFRGHNNPPRGKGSPAPHPKEPYALIFLAATLVILPLAPNRELGPFGAFNPRKIWELVVLVMGLVRRVISPCAPWDLGWGWLWPDLPVGSSPPAQPSDLWVIVQNAIPSSGVLPLQARFLQRLQL
jgi:hypothetical protein